MGTPGSGQSLMVPPTYGNFGDFTPPSVVPGSGCVPPTMITENPDQGGTGLVYCPTCNPCVQAATGGTDPAVTVFSSGGQDPLSLTIDWSNGAYSAGSNMGSGMNNSLSPTIVQVDGTGTLAVLIGGTDAMYFDWNGSAYVERYAGGDQLSYNATTKQFTLADTMGDQIAFWGFDASLPVGQQGGFQSLTDPGGNVTQVTSRTATGQIQDMQRTSDGVTESFLYTYVSSGVNEGLVANITLRRSTDGGDTWSVVRQAVFTYYDGTEPYGNAGDLEFLTVEDGSGNVLGTSYYRYYTPADAGSGGYVGGLKYFFSEQSYARVVAAVGDPTTASDSAVSPTRTIISSSTHCIVDGSGGPGRGLLQLLGRLRHLHVQLHAERQCPWLQQLGGQDGDDAPRRQHRHDLQQLRGRDDARCVHRFDHRHHHRHVLRIR